MKKDFEKFQLSRERKDKKKYQRQKLNGTRNTIGHRTHKEKRKVGKTWKKSKTEETV